MQILLCFKPKQMKTTDRDNFTYSFLYFFFSVPSKNTLPLNVQIFTVCFNIHANADLSNADICLYDAVQQQVLSNLTMTEYKHQYTSNELGGTKCLCLKRDGMSPTNGRNGAHLDGLSSRAFLVLHSIVHTQGIGHSCIKNRKGKERKSSNLSHLCTPGQRCKRPLDRSFWQLGHLSVRVQILWRSYWWVLLHFAQEAS